MIYKDLNGRTFCNRFNSKQTSLIPIEDDYSDGDDIEIEVNWIRKSDF